MSGMSLAARRRLAAVIVALTVGSFVVVLGYAVWRAMRYPDRRGHWYCGCRNSRAPSS